MQRPHNKAKLQQTEVGVNGDITIILLLIGSGRCHVDLHQSINTIDADALEDLLGGQGLEVDRQITQTGKGRVQQVPINLIQTQITIISNPAIRQRHLAQVLQQIEAVGRLQRLVQTLQSGRIVTKRVQLRITVVQQILQAAQRLGLFASQLGADHVVHRGLGLLIFGVAVGHLGDVVNNVVIVGHLVLALGLVGDVFHGGALVVGRRQRRRLPLLGNVARTGTQNFSDGRFRRALRRHGCAVQSDDRLVGRLQHADARVAAAREAGGGGGDVRAAWGASADDAGRRVGAHLQGDDWPRSGGAGHNWSRGRRRRVLALDRGQTRRGQQRRGGGRDFAARRAGAADGGGGAAGDAGAWGTGQFATV